MPAARVIVGLLGLLALSTTLQAAVIFTTGGNPDFGVGGKRLDGPGNEWDMAMRFTTPGDADYPLGGVDLALWHSTGSALVDVMVAPDVSGHPGAALETVQVTAPDTAGLVWAVFSGNSILSANTAYWVWLSAPTAGSESFWKDSSPGLSGTKASSADGGATWNPGTATLSAFEVNTLPEPATLSLLSLGLGVLVARGRRSGVPARRCGL